jgi:hypothetical protein
VELAADPDHQQAGAEYYFYYAGLADKIQGDVVPRETAHA